MGLCLPRPTVPGGVSPRFHVGISAGRSVGLSGDYVCTRTYVDRDGPAGDGVGPSAPPSAMAAAAAWLDRQTADRAGRERGGSRPKYRGLSLVKSK